MDPVSLIVAALMAGAAAGVGDAATAAVKDAYQGLKALIKEKFASNPAAEVALQQHEQAPEVWEPALRQQIAETGVDKDEAILAAAEAVLRAVPSGSRVGSPTVIVHDEGQVGVVGHGDNTIDMRRTVTPPPGG